MRSASASGVSVGSSPSPRSSSIVTSPEVKISVRGMIRVGRFLSQTQTSSSFRWKNGYVCCGTYVRSSLLHRYVASCVSTQYRNKLKTAWYSFFSWSSRSASYSSRSSRCDMRASVYPGEESLDRPLSRDFQTWIELGERAEDERALVQARVRDPQARLVDLVVAVQQKVEV